MIDRDGGAVAAPAARTADADGNVARHRFRQADATTGVEPADPARPAGGLCEHADRTVAQRLHAADDVDIGRAGIPATAAAAADADLNAAGPRARQLEAARDVECPGPAAAANGMSDYRMRIRPLGYDGDLVALVVLGRPRHAEMHVAGMARAPAHAADADHEIAGELARGRNASRHVEAAGTAATAQRLRHDAEARCT